MPVLSTYILRFGGLTVLSRITGFIRLMVLTAALGRSGLADSFLVANTIPNIIYENLLGGVLTALLLPRIVEQQTLHGKNSPNAWEAVGNLFWVTLAFSTILGGLGWLFSGPIVHGMTAYAGEARAVDRNLAVLFFAIFAWQIPFYAMHAVLMAILNSHNRFSLPAAAPIINNVISTTAIALYAAGIFDVVGLAVGTTLGIAAMALVQLPVAWRLGLPLLPQFYPFHPIFQGWFQLSWPLLVTSLVTIIGTTLRTNLLYADPGGIATFFISFQILMTPYGILAVPIATVLFPAMARAVKETDPQRLAELVRQAVGATLAVCLPVCFLVSLLAEPIVAFLFERGRFEAADTWVTAQFLAIQIWILAPYSILILLTRISYCFEDTRTPAVLLGSSLLGGILLAWLLMPNFGLNAIALGPLIANSIVSWCGWQYLRRAQLHQIHWPGFFSGTIRLCAAGGIAGLILYGAAFLYPAQSRVVTQRVLLFPQAGMQLTEDLQQPTSTLWKTFWHDLKGERQLPLPLYPSSFRGSLLIGRTQLPPPVSRIAGVETNGDGELTLIFQETSASSPTLSESRWAHVALFVPSYLIKTMDGDGSKVIALRTRTTQDFRPTVPLASAVWLGILALGFSLLYLGLILGLRGEGAEWIRQKAFRAKAR